MVEKPNREELMERLDVGGGITSRVNDAKGLGWSNWNGGIVITKMDQI